MTVSEGMVILICVEDDKECRKSVGVHEAMMMALKQGAAKMFGLGDNLPYRIIGVESGDDDGFIQALLAGEDDVDPEEVKKFIETGDENDYSEMEKDRIEELELKQKLEKEKEQEQERQNPREDNNSIITERNRVSRRKDIRRKRSNNLQIPGRTGV